MKRYDLEWNCPYPGGGDSEMVEYPDGDWVRWEDVAPLLRDALPYVDACPYKRGSKTLAADIRQALGEDHE